MHWLEYVAAARGRRRRLVIETLARRELFASDLMCSIANESLLPEAINSGAYIEMGPYVALDGGHQDLGNGTRLDSNLRKYAYLPPPDFSLMGGPGGAGDSGGSNGGGGTFEGAPVAPIYHSKPSAPKKIYLDFDGHVVSGTSWNNQNYGNGFVTGSVINGRAYSIDSDLSTFSNSELTAIREVWARMAEDFAPFQVDVTTEYPGEEIFSSGGEAIRVLISTDIDAVTGVQWFPTSAGVAYLNSWNFTDGSPVWVFYNRLGTSNSKNIAEAGSHEVGHSFNLAHDGRSSPAETYYGGHGSGATGWAPIMGVGYNRPLVQWSKGEYPSANQAQDDLAIISSNVALEPDDHGDTTAASTALVVGADGSFSASGLITTRNDKDAFRFFTQTGSVTINVAPFETSTGKANLDAELKILDASGTVVSTVNEPASLGSSLTIELQKGNYTVVVDGVGKSAVSGDAGYSDYASIGQYQVTGKAIVNASPVLTMASDVVTVKEGETLTNSGNWSDPNLSDIVVLSASTGAIVQNGDGTWSWSLPTSDQLALGNVVITATDDLGAATSKTFTIEATNEAPMLTVGQAGLQGTVLSLFANTGTWADVPADEVTLTASLGALQKKSNGTWQWTYIPSERLSSFPVTITATDEDGGIGTLDFIIDARVAVVRRSVFYAGSSFASSSVEGGLDSSKSLVRSTASPQLLTYANLINTNKGINGLVFDIAGLVGSSLDASDFSFRMSPTGQFVESANPPSSWETAPSPSLIRVVPGTASTPARVRLEWGENQIANRWLQIKILATANTGLDAPQTYYLGHLMGETNGSIEGGGFLVRTLDVSAIANAIGNQTTVTSILDLNKDGFVRTLDAGLASSSIGRRLTQIVAPPEGSSEEGEVSLESQAGIGVRWTGMVYDVLPAPNTSESERESQRVPESQLRLDAYFASLALGTAKL